MAFGVLQRMAMLKAGALYFAMVFGAGFLLGVVRTLLLTPRLGPRAAELLELPIMLAISLAAARWVMRHLAVPSHLGERAGIGAFALVLMLTAEFGFVLQLRGLSLSDYLATRDPVSGPAYYLVLLIFALMPLLIERRQA